MTNQITDMSPRQAARIAGFGYLAIFVLAIFAEFFVRGGLVVPGDAAATVNNIAAAEMLFRSGICSYLIAAVFDVVVALALYVFLRPVNRSLALLAAWFRLVHATVMGAALTNLLNVLQILPGTKHLAATETSPLHTQAMLFLDAFNYEWLIGLVFFAIHCFLLGYLILRSGFVPGILGGLLIAAALGYLTDSFAHFLLPNYADYETIFLLIVAVPAVIAELSLALWLIFKGGRLREAP